MVQLWQTADYIAPFDPGNPGFTSHWWLEDLHRAADQPLDLFTFTVDGEEAVRASVEASTRINGDSYEGWSGHVDVTEIAFLEVSAAHRGRGHGRAAVSLLAAHYGARRLAAFSENADEFWGSIGWSRLRRLDGDGAYRSLFVNAP
ncbi:GNAT family N-acetyltransferase [Microbacterium laevaniformans]|uniref:GNAT family N-acetyltransferase n=1 Tax=Microbacterium laevaniformans TaxID=36807 RepID=UPI003D953CD8